MFNDKKNIQQCSVITEKSDFWGFTEKSDFQGGGVHEKTNIEGEFSKKGDLYMLQI